MTPEELEELKAYDESNKSPNQDSFAENYLKQVTDVNITRIQGGKTFTNKIDKLNYSQIQLEELPSSGLFYRPDMEILIRSASVEEIEHFSALELNNIYDITVEVIKLLSTCVDVRYSDKKGSYKDIRKPDMFYLLFMIRDKTFQNRNRLEVSFYDKETETEGIVEICRETMDFFEVDKEVEAFYDESRRCYYFPTEFGDICLAPPTIGVYNAFFEFIRDRNNKQKKFNQSFLKIAPFMLYYRSSISIDELADQEIAFKKLTIEEFSFYDKVCTKLEKIGLKGLKHFNDNGTEVYTDIMFPDGWSTIFTVSGKFHQFIKK